MKGVLISHIFNFACHFGCFRVVLIVKRRSVKVRAGSMNCSTCSKIIFEVQTNFPRLALLNMDLIEDIRWTLITHNSVSDTLGCDVVDNDRQQ